MIKNILALLISLTLSNFAQAEFPNISVEALKKAIDSKHIAIIDVNGPASFKKGHIPGAISFSGNADNLVNFLPENKKTLIVAYCGGPGCKAYLKGAKAAAKLGYSNVKHLAAGISGRKKSGQKVEKN